MPKTNKTLYAILGVLSIHPMSGYAIRQELKHVSFFWSESDGQIYPTLAKLAKEGLVTFKSMNKADGRDKKIYSITKKGMEELTDWLKEEATTRNFRIEFLLKLFFGANVSPEINIEHIQADRYQCKMLQVKLQEIKATLLSEEKDSPHLPFWLMTLDYGIMGAEARLAWCDKALKALEKVKNLSKK